MTWTTSDKYVVLIVDDIPANLAMLSDALDDSGHIVLVATDGESALERLDHVMPDIILLDAVMPGIGGFETCRRIKCIKGASHIPIVFMTGLTETEHVLNGFEVGGIDYVTKPIQPQEVIARIDTHIRNARLLSQARSAIEAAAHAVIALRPGETPTWHTGKAGTWLEKYFPEAPALPVLPPRLQRWMDDCMEQERDDMASPLIVQHRDSKLTIAFSRAERGGECLLLLAETSMTEPPAAQMENYHLTPREADVLVWVAKGKTNRDIGDILGMSPRTVNKHLEHIYVKLGVETRSAAAAFLMSRNHRVPEATIAA